MDRKNLSRRSHSSDASSNFPFMVAIPKTCTDMFQENDGKIMRTIHENTGVNCIHFAPDLNI